ncbi:MAG TPA: hypothetical protein VF630_09515, partial [Hymenobacter sp.]|jgi:hypothetical protein
VNVVTPTIAAGTAYTGAGTPSLTPGNGNPIPGGERSRKPQDVLNSVNNFLADGSKLSATSFS